MAFLTKFLATWIKQFSEVKIDDSTFFTAKQIKDLQKRSARRGQSYLKKSHCNIHPTLRQRLIAVHIFSHEYHISTLCYILIVNRKVYRLLKTVILPKMSTVKPFSHKNAALHAENCINLLKQRFKSTKLSVALVCIWLI